MSELDAPAADASPVPSWKRLSRPGLLRVGSLADTQPMRIRAWERAAAGFGLLFAFLNILTGALAIGIGIAAAVAAVVFTRMRPAERRGVAGGHVHRNAQIQSAAFVSLIVAELAVLALLIVATINRWANHGPMGLVASVSLSGLVVMLAIELNRRADLLERWWRGADAEKAVGRELDRLPAERWFVTHNVLKERGGNIDHVAIASTGAFAIETKSGRFWGSHGAQAMSAAMELRRITGISWVTPVVCVPGDDAPCKKQNVWLVPRAQLARWLEDCRDYNGPKLDVYAARAALIA